jgi:hypothetical protein
MGHALSLQGLGMLTGKYDAKTGKLPKGVRGLLFRQILPGLEPLLSLMQTIAKERRKSVSQVSHACRTPFIIHSQALDGSRMHNDVCMPSEAFCRVLVTARDQRQPQTCMHACMPAMG